MKFRLLPILIATVIGLTARAEARQYYLVGLRHIYMFDVWPDPYKLDRQAIEETYAGALADAQKQYDTDMASIRDEEAKDDGNVHQVDRDAVQQNLEQDIEGAAEKRDNELSQLYVQCDYVRESHPEFAVDQDGPYQVMGVDVDESDQPVDVCYFRPYPAYVGPCPFGWNWGRPYPFATFSVQIALGHSTWLSIGSPVFGALYYKGVAFTVLAPVRAAVIVNRGGWVGGRPPIITANDRKAWAASRDLQRKAGIRPLAAHPGTHAPRTIGAQGPVSRYARKPTNPPAQSGSPSRYSRSGSGPSGSGPSSSSGSRGRSSNGPGSSGGGNAHGRGGNGGDDRKKGN